MTTGHKIVSNMIYFFLDSFVLTFFGYIFWMIMGKMLPPDQYGILTAVMALFYIFVTITTLGLVESVPKLVAELIKKNNKAAAGGMINYSFKIILGLGTLISILLYLGSEWISQTLYHVDTIAEPLKLVAVLLFMSNIGNIVKATLQSLQNYRVIFISDSVGALVRIFLAAGLVMLGWAVAGGLVAWTAYFATLVMLGGYSALRHHRFPKGSFDKKSLWHFSTLSAASQFTFYLIQQGGVLIVAALMGAADVGYLGVAMLFAQVLLFMPTVIIGAVMSNLSQLWASNKEHFRKLLSISIKVTVLTVLPFSIIFTLSSDFLIKTIYSVSYLPAASVFPAYMFAAFFYGLVRLLLIGLYSAGRPVSRLLITTFGAVVNIGLCLLLIPMLGIVGAAHAFLISQIIMFLVAVSETSKTIQLSFSKHSLWCIPALGVLASVLALQLFITSLMMEIALIVVGLSVYTLFLFATRVIGKQELELLDYFPDKFGLGTLKKMVRTVIFFFNPAHRSAAVR